METAVPQPANGQIAPEFSLLPPSLPASVSVLEAPPEQEYLAAVLQSLETMKNGDFSVRLPVTWTGLPGKIANNFNEIVMANEQMASELRRVGQAVGKEGKTRERIRVETRARRLGRDGSLGEHAGGRLAAADHRSHSRHRRRGAGQFDADRALGRRRPAA